MSPMTVLSDLNFSLMAQDRCLSSMHLTAHCPSDDRIALPETETHHFFFKDSAKSWSNVTAGIVTPWPSARELPRVLLFAQAFRNSVD